MVQSVKQTNVKQTTTQMSLQKSKVRTEVNYYNIQDAEWKKCVFKNNTTSGAMALEMINFLDKNKNGNISSADMISKWTSITSTQFSEYQEMHNFSISTITKAEFAMNNMDKVIQNFCQDNSDGGTYVTPREQGIIIQALDAFCKYVER